ncbi:unknown [Prevotella sp. CAG:873]|nr:unknown [Prevotella sp. CAG:873]
MLIQPLQPAAKDYDKLPNAAKIMVNASKTRFLSAHYHLPILSGYGTC